MWAYDFVTARTHDGRPLKILAVVEEYSRECLALVVARRLRSTEVLETWAALFVTYGVPAHIRSACYEQVVTYGVPAHIRSACYEQVVTYGVPAHIRSACYEQVVTYGVPAHIRSACYEQVVTYGVPAHIRSACYEQVVTYGVPAHIRSACYEQVVTYGVPAHIRSACYEQVVTYGVPAHIRSACYEQVVTYGVPAHIRSACYEQVVTYGVPAHIRSACYEQVVKALGAVGSSNRGTDTGSGSVEPAHRASSGLIPEERRVPGGSTSSCLRREELRTTVGMASSPVGVGASGFYAAIDSSLHTWSASNAVRFLTTANASCSSLVMQAPIACIGGKGRVTRCVRRS